MHADNGAKGEFNGPFVFVQRRSMYVTYMNMNLIDLSLSLQQPLLQCFVSNTFSLFCFLLCIHIGLACLCLECTSTCCGCCCVCSRRCDDVCYVWSPSRLFCGTRLPRSVKWLYWLTRTHTLPPSLPSCLSHLLPLPLSRTLFLSFILLVHVYVSNYFLKRPLETLLSLNDQSLSTRPLNHNSSQQLCLFALEYVLQRIPSGRGRIESREASVGPCGFCGWLSQLSFSWSSAYFGWSFAFSCF